MSGKPYVDPKRPDADLRERGVITDAEFEGEKAWLLNHSTT